MRADTSKLETNEKYQCLQQLENISTRSNLQRTIDERDDQLKGIEQLIAVKP